MKTTQPFLKKKYKI